MEGRPLEDEALVERARRGDAGAYEELITRYQALAHRVAYLVLGDAAEAEDATQEAFVKAYYALGGFRSGAAFKPWLVIIVTNEARNRRRSAGRRAGLVLRAGIGRASEDAAPSSEAVALKHERREELMRAINELKEPDRIVILYRYFLEMSEAEMAAALGCAPGTVKSRLSRALAKLRNVVGDAPHVALGVGDR